MYVLMSPDLATIRGVYEIWIAL